MIASCACFNLSRGLHLFLFSRLINSIGVNSLRIALVSSLSSVQYSIFCFIFNFLQSKLYLFSPVWSGFYIIINHLIIKIQSATLFS